MATVLSQGSLHLSHLPRNQLPTFPQPFGSLSPREERVLRFVAQGYINKEIADALSVTLETVRTHLKNIYLKLDVHSRTEAVVKYFQYENAGALYAAAAAERSQPASDSAV